MASIESLQNEIDKIKERNTRVEKDKEWETSLIRRVSVAIATYIVVLLFFIVIGASQPLISALVPSIGFLLSTASLDVIKNRWLKKQRRQ